MAILKFRQWPQKNHRDFSGWVVQRIDRQLQKFPNNQVLKDLARETFPKGKKHLTRIERYRGHFFCCMRIGIRKKNRERFLASLEKVISAK